MKLRDLVKKLNTNYYNLLFTGSDYPEPLTDQDIRSAISTYIEHNFSRLAVNEWFIEDDYTLSDYHEVVKNVLIMNAWNIAKKYEITQAEFNPVENYDKYSEIDNQYGQDKNTTSYGQDKNTTSYGQDKSTTSNGATNSTTTNSVTGFDSDTFKNNNKSVTDTNAYSDSTTRDAHTDSMTRDAHTDTVTRDAHNDKMIEHTHGNIGVLTVDAMLKGVWTLADLNFFSYVADLIVNSICMSIFECEV